MSSKLETFSVLILFTLLIVSGTFFYSNYEGWNRLDSAYFSIITLTTIGYGDFAPSTDIGKIFTIFYALIGVGIMLYLISLVGKKIVELEVRRVKEHENRKLRDVAEKIDKDYTKQKTLTKKPTKRSSK